MIQKHLKRWEITSVSRVNVSANCKILSILKEIRDVVKDSERDRTSDEVEEEAIERTKMEILKDIASKHEPEDKESKSKKSKKKKK